MKKSVILPIVAIAVAACVLLGLNFGLKGVAQGRLSREHVYLMRTVLPGSEHFTVEPYAGEDQNIRSVHRGETGFVIETKVYGYAGDLRMLVGVSQAGKVTGLVVLELEETPGLGSNALTDTDFLAQFLNTQGGVAIGVPVDTFSGATGEDAGETEVYVDGLTGATVTSKAVARSVNSAVAYVTGADVDSGATAWGG